MNPEGMMLPSHKRTNTGFPLHEVPRIISFIETGSRVGGGQGLGEGDGELAHNVGSISVWEDGKSLEMDGCTTHMNILNFAELYA